MPWPQLHRLALFAAALLLSWPLAAADKRTVCTITINSADEKEAFRHHLPASTYRFVELVERGRTDWLASACREAVACDVLVVSGHYDGGNEFFSDQAQASEFLTVDELERVSCSQTCPALFSRLSEVYLFGCNTLNPLPLSSATAETVRSLVRAGHSPKEAARQLQSLNAAHGESSRDRMRQIFTDVPAIYGFSSTAPLGPVAASKLNGYFGKHGTREMAQGRPSKGLLAEFAPHGMTVTAGMNERDPRAAVRHDVCQFVDDRLSDAQRLAFVHGLLQRQMAQARIHLDRLQRYTAVLNDPARRTPEVRQALSQIASDKPVRADFLDFARDTDRPEVRVRMLQVAHDLGWLTGEEQQQEIVLMLNELQARSDLGIGEVDLACSLNQAHALDAAFNPLAALGPDDLAHAALRACLGSAQARQRTLDGLASPRELDVQVARAYLRQRPITDATELRRVAAAITAMRASAAQVLALEALGRLYLSDGAVLDGLIQLFAATPSWQVQAAVADILIRADSLALARAQLVQTLTDKRKPVPAGAEDLIDELIQKLQRP
jgi:hypothetical protein